MSADNGIYIGKFPKMEDELEYDYRVIHGQAIENIYYFPDSELETSELEAKFQGENPREIFDYFKDALNQTEEEAHKKAFEMEQEILNDDFAPILEYGINTLTFLHSFSFYQEHASEIVYNWEKAEREK